jgi:hypothetical protein
VRHALPLQKNMQKIKKIIQFFKEDFQKNKGYYVLIASALVLAVVGDA